MLVQTIFHDRPWKSHGMALWQIVTLGQGFSFSLLDTAEQSQCLVGQYHTDGVPIYHV